MYAESQRDNANANASQPSVLPVPVRASVAHLISKACNLPCSAAAQAFTQLVQPTARFQLALDALLPLLSGGNAEVPQRILVCYILYSLYASHPIVMNPFYSAFTEAFEREKGLANANNEQVVWVLWKILRGGGNELATHSPQQLAQLPVSEVVMDDTSMINGNGQVRANTNITLSALEEDDSNSQQAQALKLLHVACTRVLSLTEQRTIVPALHSQSLKPTSLSPEKLASLISYNPPLGHPLVVTLLKSVGQNQTQIRHCDYLDVLVHLPPTLPSFDLLGRLLRDPTTLELPANTNEGENRREHQRVAVKDLVRNEVLGRFITNCIDWIERSEHEEKQGLVSDDRVAKSVQNLCRFFTSLMKLGILDPSFDADPADSAEMAHFALNHSRYEEANALYRVLVKGKF